MKVKGVLKELSVEDAYKNLETEVGKFLKTAQWVCGFNGYVINGKVFHTRINELRIPFLTLKRAKKNALK